MPSTPPFGNDREHRVLMSVLTDHAIFMLDLNGNVISWDAGAQRATGYSDQEIIGQHFAIFSTEPDRLLHLPEQRLSAALRDGRCETEGWRVRKDGTRFWALAVLALIRDGDSIPIGFDKITRDITERHAVEQARLETEHRFRLLVEGVTDYAIYLLDEQGYVKNWNSGGTRIKGYAAEEIIGEHFSRFYTPEDQASGLPGRGLDVARAAGRFEDAGWRVRKDGTRFWASVVIDAIHDDDGHLIGFAKITRDLTEQRIAQRRLDEQRERSVQAEKLEAIGRLTSSVTHDFNNLLQVILASTRAAQKLVDGSPKLNSLLGGIEHAVKQGSLISQRLLTCSHPAALNPEVVATAATLHQAMDLFCQTLGEGVQVDRDVPDDLWPVRIDVAQFEAALLNIVVNAHDAMPGGGRLTVTAVNRALGNEPGCPDGSFVAISVRDTGVGIPKEILNRIFEPFFTTKPAGKGTGLGLSHVRGFANQAGGTVTIASEPDQGTVVTMLLPADVPLGRRADQPHAPKHVDQGR